MEEKTISKDLKDRIFSLAKKILNVDDENLLEKIPLEYLKRLVGFHDGGQWDSLSTVRKQNLLISTKISVPEYMNVGEILKELKSAQELLNKNTLITFEFKFGLEDPKV